MVRLTRPGGWLFLSGIPLQDKFDIQRRFVNLGCSLVEMQIMEDFVTFVMQRG
jgi:ribosomal protein L11 methyltransferase